MEEKSEEKIIKYSIDECICKSSNTITNIYEKYKEDDWMLSKINSYINNQLPNVIDNIKTTHEQRIARIEELTNEQDNFVQSFLNDNQYFFNSATDRFFYYDGIHYQIINEDDILHKILTTITRGRNLMSWKQRTKIHIMKRIKETSLITSIPESDTIQGVIDSLYPTLFPSRNEAKYFLTILGDNIHRKNTNLIHYIKSSSRQFIKELNHVCQFLIGISVGQTFKNKYHDHSYNECRLVNITDTVRHEHVWKNIIHNIPLDIICVASHYSIRYGSSDEFIINTSNDNELLFSAFYIKNMDTNLLITNFITEYLDITLPNEGSITNIIPENSDGLIRAPQITWKNMQYLWKHFLDTKNLPHIMFLNTFKNLLLEKIGVYYSEDQDSFIGICSKHLPAIQKFLYFWDETIILDDSEFDFEIEEIVSLFKKWCGINNIGSINLNDKQIIDLIQYFFPSIDIERDKFISGIRCELWDKQLDIQTALDNHKEALRTKHSTNGITSPGLNNMVSIYDTYTYYCKFFSSSSSLIVSKTYFEKYIFDNFEDYIVDNKFLSQEWYIL
jgi:hypothetical protein|tara:strand:+ start:12765 stop:14441 length:1677 start_codon:yes stop_codon:yes gene_type:complete